MKALPLAFAWAALAATASAQPGTLDPTFGTGGVATFMFGYDEVNPGVIHALPDGRLLANGIIGDSNPFNTKVLLYRAMPDGQLDNTFGQQGLVAYAPQGSRAMGFKSSVRPDGSVIVVGSISTTDGIMAVWKFTEAGVMDTDFGLNGLLTIAHPAAGDLLLALVETAPDVFVAGGTWSDQQADQVCLIKFNADGVLDPSFGSNGKVVHDLFPGQSELIDHLYLNADGSFLAQINRDVNVPLLARFLSDGQLDVTYGTSGWVELPGDCDLTYPELAVLPNGNALLATASVLGQAQFIQVDPNGTLVSSFGSAGVLVAEPSSDPTQMSSILALPDGSWIGAGSINTPIPLRETMVCHYLPNGSLDTGFGQNGCFRQSFYNSPRSWDMVLKPSGQLVVLASNWSSTTTTSTHLLAMEAPITGIEELVANQQVRCSSGADAAFVDLASGAPSVSSVTFHDITGKLVAQVAPASTSTSSSRALQISYPTAMEPGCYVMRLQDRTGKPIGNCAVVKAVE